MDNSETKELPLRLRANTIPSNGTRDPTQPSQEPDAGDGDGNGGDQEVQEDRDYGEVTHVPPVEVKKKKKRSKRPASQRGLGKPSGFEDYFADAPLTPEQHAEEQEIYHPRLPFVDRVATAIARFERSRKLTPQRRDALYKYLMYGGLTVRPNIGQGGLDTEGMDKTQIALALSQVWISEDKRNLGTETSVYEVDFLGCAKGFLSRRAKDIFGLDTEDEVNMVCTTLERFMDYLLQHDVCPEYKEDVLAARELCRKAGPELWDMAEATRRLPGEFNIACSTLFDGSYSRDYDGETWWGNSDGEEAVFVGLKPDEAQQIVKFGVAGAATEKVYTAFLAGVQQKAPKMMDVVKIEERTGFEITRIEPPTKACKQIYTSHSQHFRPVGCVYAKPWKNPDALPEDLTPAEKEALSPPSVQAAETEYVFFIESILQSCLRVGTKVEATVRTLGCGITFFDEVLNVYPSFDEFLVNEMMVGWKSPRPVKGALDYVSGDDSDGGEDDGGGEEGGDGEVGKNMASPADEEEQSK
ncbi:uncharacterized protein A1O5_12559 [Cladophialophora psammophila CBS 110553]|uniref:Argonaute siRNA chaperone complex subunit Arb1 n=1 Tax=Cladophialophora psammophila CBS 110553 TaxID=1182543 RepID=W9VKT4_9EURO|nr:uncharacterized protein A1O5_12559 [Cladophialophora psammophila CBS 110553]EXJ56292.1 hypothetical protein A1O5_12559 [Cladophialophora psammophila CBS 110553]